MAYNYHLRVLLLLLPILVTSCLTDHRTLVDPQGKQYLLTHITEEISNRRERDITYNAQGKPILSTYTFYTESQPSIPTEMSYRYDSEGRLIQTAWGNAPHIATNPVVITDYTYDSNGKLNSRTNLRCNVSATDVIYWVERFDYDEQNRINKIYRDYYYDQGRTNQFSDNIFFTEVQTLQFDSRNNVTVIDLASIDATTKEVFLRGRRINQFDDKPNPLYGIELFGIEAFYRTMSPNNIISTQSGSTTDPNISLEQISKFNQVYTRQYTNGLVISESDNVGNSRKYTYTPR